MLRIPFTAEDLTRVTFRRFDPWAEALLSLRALYGRGYPPWLATWRHAVIRQVAAGRLEREMRALSTLARTDLFLVDVNPAPFRDALTAYRGVAIDPYRHQIATLVNGELQTRSGLLLDGGYASCLDGLGNHTRWSGSVLEASYPERHEVPLSGRGLLLLPAVFCPPDRVLLAGPKERPTVIYPVRQSAAAIEPGVGEHPRNGLAALLGTTRATVLEVISESCSTTELAARLRVSLATASQHATVLRQTGLVTTRRDGRRVEHTLTPLGRRLLLGAEGCTADA